MVRFLILLVSGVFLLASCTTTTTTGVGTNARPGMGVYRISKLQTSRIQFRMLDSVNALRKAEGLGNLSLNSSLNAAAATHSRDMAVQNRPWHFGSDGSSPVERAWRAGYRQTMLGENISETYETELETLAAWMDQKDTRNVIVAEQAQHLGFSWHQEPGGKIWWTLIIGGGATPVQPSPNSLAQVPQG
ncbi:MAG: CAP domain-containing protein [Rhodobacteraceae bacterium]|nr:CAP domain-containing protein [Paracoccaceae bacterium]